MVAATTNGTAGVTAVGAGATVGAGRFLPGLEELGLAWEVRFLGAGFAMALACDLRLCAENAKFGMAFRNVGLPGDFGGAYFLPRVVGQGVAREIFFSGEPITMDRAEALGLANRVYAKDEFLPQALEYVSRIGQGPTKALGRMKANLNRSGEDSTMEEILLAEARATRLSRDDADHSNAVQAFIDGEKPVFSGR